MLPDLFVDTSGWASLVDATQPAHLVANRLYDKALQQGRRIVTTNYVIAELVALLQRPLRMPRSVAIQFIDQLKGASLVEIVHITPALDDAAWQLLKDRPDKAWSLVDCASFVVMQQRGMTEALTTDQHFEQAGLSRLLT